MMATKKSAPKKSPQKSLKKTAPAKSKTLPAAKRTRMVTPKPVAKKRAAVVKRVVGARPLRVLVICHNHPDFFPGGTEIFAHRLFSALNASPGVEAFFLAATGRISSHAHSGTAFQSLAAEGRPNEWLFWGDAFDYFLQSQRALSLLHADFVELLLELQPDIVHFHHTLRIGMEAIHLVRRHLPKAKILYTLHDFIPICHRDGQMVKMEGDALCTQAAPSACARCFPAIAPDRFKTRELFIKGHFSQVDRFIAPSTFLAGRYREWGIDAPRITVLQNGHLQADAGVPSPRKLPRGGKRNRFAFFGQVTPYKGVLLLLEAAMIAAQQERSFQLDIYGNVSLQTEAFQQQFRDALAGMPPQVTFHGPYRQEELAGLMQQADWVVVPSTWWENAPLVIDEALMHGRPVICADIGGMAEKIHHRKNGLHFRAGQAQSLAQTLIQAMREAPLWAALHKSITPPVLLRHCADRHVKLYRELLQENPASHTKKDRRKSAG